MLRPDVWALAQHLSNQDFLYLIENQSWTLQITSPCLSVSGVNFDTGQLEPGLLVQKSQCICSF